MGDRRPINPYAPTIESGVPVDAEKVAAESSEQIRFAAELDVDRVRNTDHVALIIGLILGVGFAALLAASGMFAILADRRGGLTGTFLLVAASVLLLAVWLFVMSQQKKPLRKYSWMSGLVQGVLHADRIDIQWGIGQASLTLPRLTPTADFANRYGRLFVCRGIPCFIPFAGVDRGAWLRLRSFRPRHSAGAPAIALAPEPPRDALVWRCSQIEFMRDREDHQFTCEPAGLSRFVFWACMLLCLVTAIVSSRPSLSTLACFAGGMLISGLLWSLREGVRRNWRFRYPHRRPFWRSTNDGLAADYPRWMNDDMLMLGYIDGWFCLPWTSIRRAVISQHGIEFMVGTESIDAWFLERGDRLDQQWQAIIHHVASRIPDTRLFGSVRGEKAGSSSSTPLP